jgi:hypothetical protein
MTLSNKLCFTIPKREAASSKSSRSRLRTGCIGRCLPSEVARHCKRFQDPDGREIVESLLLDWERSGAYQAGIRPDLDAVRKLLSLMPSTP